MTKMANDPAAGGHPVPRRRRADGAVRPRKARGKPALRDAQHLTVADLVTAAELESAAEVLAQPENVADSRAEHAEAVVAAAAEPNVPVAPTGSHTHTAADIKLVPTEPIAANSDEPVAEPHAKPSPEQIAANLERIGERFDLLAEPHAEPDKRGAKHAKRPAASDADGTSGGGGVGRPGMANGARGDAPAGGADGQVGP